MSRQHYLPDGRYVLVPDSMSYEAADRRAAHDFPESFGIKQKHGPWEAFKAGVGQGVGSGIQTLGQLTSSPRMEAYGAKLAAPGTEPGAYRPTSEEDISAAWQRGMTPGARAWLNQKALEPVAEAFGRYALPTAAAAAVAPLIPEAGALGLSATAAARLLGGAAFTAADVPTAYQGNVQEQQQETERARTEGRPAPQFSLTNNIMSALAQSAIVPVLGAFGQKAVAMMGPDLAAMTQRVLRGEITKEAAAATLNSTAKNIALQMGQAGVVGGVMMPATQALQMSQAGEDLSSPEAIARMKQAAITGLEFAPIGALAGFGRKGQERALDQAAAAGPERAAQLGTREQAAAQEEAARTAKEQHAAQIAAQPPGTQLGLDIPGQEEAAQVPSIDAGLAQVQQKLNELSTLKKVQQAAGKTEDVKQTTHEIKTYAAALKQLQDAKRKSLFAAPETVEPQPDTVTPARMDLNQAIYGGAGSETFADARAAAADAWNASAPSGATFKPLFDSLGIPGGMRKLRAFEDHPLADDAARTEVKDQLTRLAEKTKTEGLATKIEAALNGPLFWEQQGLGMKLPTGEEMQASQYATRWKAQQEKMQSGAKQARVNKVAAREEGTTPGAGGTEDMFSGAVANRVPQEAPEAQAAASLYEAMYPKFETAYNAWKQKPNDPGLRAQLDAVVAEARKGTLFEEKQNGPSNELPTTTPEQGAGRAGNGEPVSGRGRPEPAAGAGSVGRGVPLNERPAVGAKPIGGALEPLGNALMQAAEAQKNLATTETRGTKQREIGPTGIGGAALPKTIEDLAPVTQKLKDAEPVTWWNDLAWMQRNRDTNPVARKGIEQGLAAKMFTRKQLEERAIPIDDTNRARQVNMQGAIRALEAGRTEAAKKSKRAATQTYERSRQDIEEQVQEAYNPESEASMAAKAHRAALEAEELDHRLISPKETVVLEQDGVEHEVPARGLMGKLKRLDDTFEVLRACAFGPK